METLFQYLYINFFIMKINLKLKLDFKENLKKKIERKIILKHIVEFNSKSEKFYYNIEDSRDNNSEILIISDKINYLSFDEIKRLEVSLMKNVEPLNSASSSKKRKSNLKRNIDNADSNVIDLEKFRSKRKKKY